MKRKHLKKLITLENNYFLFIQFLYDQNYDLWCDDIGDEYLQCKIKDRTITGYMWLNKNQNGSYNSGVAIDNIRCFDKISRCPFKMKIPNPNKFYAYLSRFRFWGTKEGYLISNFFKFDQWDHDGT